MSDVLLEPSVAVFAPVGSEGGQRGVEFIDENGGGPGLRLRKPQRSKQSK